MTPVPASETPRPRRGRPGHDRETVVARSVALFNERGYDATSITDIARDLGVTKSAVYHHVASKDELLAAALDEALGALTAVLDAAETGAGSAHDRLQHAVAGSVRALAAHLPAVTLLLRVRGNSAVEADALARRRDIDDRLADLVRAAAAEGSVRADLDPVLASRLLFGTVNSLHEWYRPGGALGPDELAETVSSLVLDGLGPD